MTAIDSVLGARAWCVPEKMMYDVGEIHFCHGGIRVEGTGVHIGNGWATRQNGFEGPCDVILLKYAGISDDDGKRLHDGDIIQWAYEDITSFTAKVVYVDFETTGDLDIGQRHVGFMIEFNDHGGEERLRYSDLPDKDTGFKIIGNVYENPELWESS